jgi:site-specific DNA-methyltransferase (adenine-specific)
VATHAFKEAHFASFLPDLIRPCILAGAPLGGVVLDPFGGAGTTAVVAMQEGRKSILCEINPDYAVMAERRIAAASLDGAAQMDVFRDLPPAA